MNRTKTLVSIAALAVLTLVLTPGAWAGANCSNATLNGRYAATISGTVSGLPLAELDIVTSTGNGSFSGSGTVSFNGSVSAVTISATYTINSDCSGSAVLSDGTTQNLAIKSDGSEVFFIGTNDPTAQVLGDARRLNSHED